MSPDKLNETLERHARANEGTNHGSEYDFCILPSADSLTDALGFHFAQIKVSSVSTGWRLETTEAWDIRITTVDKPDEVLIETAQAWFFGLEHSPKVSSSAAADEVLDFVIDLRRVVGNALMYMVRVSPPMSMWYGCHWEDFAFDGDSQRWLLHFGFSD